MISREELILRFMCRPKYIVMDMGHSQPIGHKPKYPTFKEAAVMADDFIAKAQTEDEE